MANKFEMKKWEIEEYGRIYERLEARIKDLGYTYGQLEEMEQATRWNSETKSYEPVWEDEEGTIPKMVNKWGDIEIPEDELTDDIRAKRKVCETLMAFIEKQC